MHILAVDDDPIILEIIVEVVRSMGDHEASIAESAMEAIGLINTAPVGTYDCCLLDIQMPGTDGIALCKMLRGRKDFRAVPIVMLTAMSDKRYVDAAFAAGANDYIVKPFEVVELQRRIRQAEQRAIRTQAVPGSAQAQAEATGKPDLAEAFHIFDVDNLIDYPALENYLPLLSQPTLYNTVALGFHIRQAAEIHGLCSGLQFRGLIEDVAETISDTLRSQEFLMAYAGRGTFLCVVQENTIPPPGDLVDQINIDLQRLDMQIPTPHGLPVRICTGGFVRLFGYQNDALATGLNLAGVYAEREGEFLRRETEEFWRTRQEV